MDDVKDANWKTKGVEVGQTVYVRSGTSYRRDGTPEIPWRKERVTRVTKTQFVTSDNKRWYVRMQDYQWGRYEYDEDYDCRDKKQPAQVAQHDSYTHASISFDDPNGEPCVQAMFDAKRQAKADAEEARRNALSPLARFIEDVEPFKSLSWGRWGRGDVGEALVQAGLDAEVAEFVARELDALNSVKRDMDQVVSRATGAAHGYKQYVLGQRLIHEPDTLTEEERERARRRW
jgi:hypothetical protein